MSNSTTEIELYLDLLESNGDNVNSVILSACNYKNTIGDFEYDVSSCNVCNGYYGPNFGEPICVTCHSFLFPNFGTYLPASYFTSDKTDDGDSGNDEPSDLNYALDKKLSRCQTDVNFLQLFQSSGDDVSPEIESPRLVKDENGDNCSSSGDIDDIIIRPPIPPNFEHRLRLLSTPRPPDNLQPGLVESLPPEVLLCIFNYLDDLSLVCAGLVCTRWRGIVKGSAGALRGPPWRRRVHSRWPLFKPLLVTEDWFKIFQNLVLSCFCQTCLMQMSAQIQPSKEDNTWRRNRLRSELKLIRTDPSEGIDAIPLDTNFFHWQATITGPAGSPYEGGLFYLYLQVPFHYPLVPPTVRFLTKILHPNVSRHGDIGIDSIHHNWSLALTISKVLVSVQSLLTDPFITVCMEPEVGRMYVEERIRFENLARQWTWKYAMIDALPQQSTQFD